MAREPYEGIFRVPPAYHSYSDGFLFCRIRRMRVLSVPDPDSTRVVRYEVQYWVDNPIPTDSYSSPGSFETKDLQGNTRTEFAYEIPNEDFTAYVLEISCIAHLLKTVLGMKNIVSPSELIAYQNRFQARGKYWVLYKASDETGMELRDVYHELDYSSADGGPLELVSRLAHYEQNGITTSQGAPFQIDNRDWWTFTTQRIAEPSYIQKLLVRYS